MTIQPLTGKAAQVLAHPSPSIEAYEGAVRSSKTITSLIDWLRFIRTGPAGNLVMAGRTERTVINNLILPLQEMLGPDRVQVNYGSGTVAILGREIILVGANNEQARTKIQGLTLAGAYVDEAATLPESFFNMLYSRLSVPGAKLWLTANPEGPAHWLKTKWLDRARLWITKTGDVIRNTTAGALDLHRYTFVLDDNPSLTPEYVERIKKSYTGMWHRRFIDGEWVAADGIIYAAYDHDKHVIPFYDLPPMRMALGIGIDYGTTNASTGIAGYLGQDNRIYLTDEWRVDQKTRRAPLTDSELSASFRTWHKNPHHPTERHDFTRFYVDPAAASFKTQLARDGIRHVWNADNNVTQGIKLVASLLATDRLRISDRCQGLLDELPGYTWDTKASEKGEDKPVKENDHSADAMRYLITTSESWWRRHIPAI